MKSECREKARQLRAEGYSLAEILTQVPVSKASVSLWVRDIPLTEEQQSRLSGKRASAEKFRVTTLAKTQARIAGYRHAAETEYGLFVADVDFMYGLALYVGEGSKTKVGVIELANCDVRVIVKARDWFCRIGAARESLRCRLQLHPGMPEDAALRYWIEKIELPRSQFSPILNCANKANQGRSYRVQPYGTMTLSFHSTPIYHKLIHWINLSLGA